MKKIYISIICCFPLLHVFGQLQGVTLQNIQGCGGATLIALPTFGSNINPVTLNYEKQVSGNWFLVVAQVYHYTSNHILVGPPDVSGATFYRVRAVDAVTFQEFISAGVTVNPATWGVDRGTAFCTAVTSWGNLCDNSRNYLQVTCNYTANGRPPFTVQYKKGSDANYSSAGTVTAGTLIFGITPNTIYNVRVTDACGKVSMLNATPLELRASPSIQQNATTCSNGIITVGANGGVSPHTYAVGKVVADMGTIYPVMNFVSTNVFGSLAPGDYYAQVKDSCGSMSLYYPIRLGAGFPRISTAVTSIPADSCFRNITVTTFTGTAPFQYGIRYIHDPAFTFQTSNVFTSLSRNGVYFIRIIDACGQISDSVAVSANFPVPTIDSTRQLSTSSSCIKDIKVYAKSGYKPYQYGIRTPFTANFVFQTSDTFRNLSATQLYYIVIRDRCGHESSVTTFNPTSASCALRTTPGDFESVNSPQGCQDYSGNSWIDLKDDAGQLILSINPQNNLLDDLCWGVRVAANSGSLRQSGIQGSNAYFLDRNFYLEPQNPIVLNNPISIRVYFTSVELQNMLSYLSSILGRPVIKEELRILKKKGNAGSPVDLEVTNENMAASNQLTIVHPTILPFGNDWFMEFTVNDLSEFNPFYGQLTGLPLRFVTFDAKKHNGTITLLWSTTDELNTDKFEIEWATDGIHFRNIGTVPSKNLATLNRYSFTHLTPKGGTNYYRLKQVDKDDQFTLSKVISMAFADRNPIVTPNPASDRLNINLPMSHQYKSIRVFDAVGSLVLQKDIHPATGNIHVDVSRLVKGWYVLEFVGSHSTRTAFIKR